MPIGEKKENPAIIPVYTPEQIEKLRTVCRVRFQPQNRIQ